MRLLINGAQQDVQSLTLDALLAELGYATTVVATAVNAAFVPVSARSATAIMAGDQVEILAPMQGG